MAQKTDLELIAEANVIRDETAIGANTALRIGTMLDNLVDSKINNDRVSDSTSLGNSTTLVPSQNAVKTYVDAFATGLLTDNGNYDPTITSEYPTSGDTLSGGAVQKGDIWYISADGTMNGNAVLVGYSVRALVDNAGATTDASWSISNVGIGFVPENVANKSTDVNLGTSDIYYPSQNAVKTYVDTEVAAAIPFTPENLANKSQDIISNPSSTVLYPSNKAVADYIAFGVDLQAVTDSGNTTTIDIHVQNSIASENATDSSSAYLSNNIGGTGAVGIVNKDGYFSEIKGTNLTGNRTIQLPDADGTLALLSDIPTSSSWDLTGNAGTTPGTNFIGTTDANDVVFKAGGVEYFKLSIADQLLLLSKSITCNSTSTTEIAVRSTAIPNNGFVAINQNATDKGNILVNNGDSTTKITTLASGALRTVSLPNASGTLALESYKVYTALVSRNPTVSKVELQNGLSATITITFDFAGTMSVTCSSPLFVSNKVFIMPTQINAGGTAYFVIGNRISTTQIDYDIIRYDGTTGITPNFTNLPIEIKIYP
tara:strand:- start:18199 stop:19827 length:1629 start_codon:yes stop_codon:yes gene_type:complete